MCEKIGVLLIYLSAYLYDFNFIKISFVFLKSYIRRYGRLTNTYISEDSGF